MTASLLAPTASTDSLTANDSQGPLSAESAPTTAEAAPVSREPTSREPTRAAPSADASGPIDLLCDQAYHRQVSAVASRWMDERYESPFDR